MTGTEFITSVFCSECTYDEPRAITPDEAAETIAAWNEEGLPVPVSVTPVLFAKVWNLLCAKATR